MNNEDIVWSTTLCHSNPFVTTTLSQKPFCYNNPLSQQPFVTTTFVTTTLLSQQPYVTTTLYHNNPLSQQNYVTTTLCHKNPLSQQPFATTTLCYNNPILQPSVCNLLQNISLPTRAGFTVLKCTLARADMHTHRHVHTHTHKTKNKRACTTRAQVGKLARTRADILLKLTSDLPATTHKLLGLRDLFPGINVSMLVSRWPYLVSFCNRTAPFTLNP